MDKHIQEALVYNSSDNEVLTIDDKSVYLGCEGGGIGDMIAAEYGSGGYLWDTTERRTGQ